MNSRLVTALAGGTPLLALASGFAHDDRLADGERRQPPPVAIEACAALVEGDACSFEGRRGARLNGRCAAVLEDALACRPEGRPPRRGHPHDDDGARDTETDKLGNS